jgi:hypothetical protein
VEIGPVVDRATQSRCNSRQRRLCVATGRFRMRARFNLERMAQGGVKAVPLSRAIKVA